MLLNNYEAQKAEMGAEDRIIAGWDPGDRDDGGYPVPILTCFGQQLQELARLLRDVNLDTVNLHKLTQEMGIESSVPLYNDEDIQVMDDFFGDELPSQRYIRDLLDALQDCGVL